jgi:non-heme chloroperoxidase
VVEEALAPCVITPIRRSGLVMSRRQPLLATGGVAAALSLPKVEVAKTASDAKLPVHPTSHRGSDSMTTATMKDGAKIYFKDWGAGPVVTFSHGWPLTADAWDA